MSGASNTFTLQSPGPGDDAPTPGPPPVPDKLPPREPVVPLKLRAGA